MNAIGQRAARFIHSSLRVPEASSDLTWAPSYPSSQETDCIASFAFASNLTPSEFVATEDSSPAFISYSPTAATRKRRRISVSTKDVVGADSPPESPRSADAPRIPRPPNAFILFRASFIRGISVSDGASPAAMPSSSHSDTSLSTAPSAALPTDLSAIAGAAWAALGADQKSQWYDKAKEERERHRERFPGYTYTPRNRTREKGRRTSSMSAASSSSSDGASGSSTKEKRIKRDIPPTDHERCAHIAALILSGLAGPALDSALEQYDRDRKAEAEKSGKGVVLRWATEEAEKRSMKCKTKPEAPVTKERKTATPKRRRVMSESALTCIDYDSSCSSSIVSPQSAGGLFDMSTALFDFDFDSSTLADPVSPTLSYASAVSRSPASSCTSASSSSSSPAPGTPSMAYSSLADATGYDGLQATFQYREGEQMMCLSGGQFDLEAAFESWNQSCFSGFSSESMDPYGHSLAPPFEPNLGLSLTGFDTEPVSTEYPAGIVW
ncbi:unnamed protein product [Mycena citricolor]|uniref:HMG box domain-containing protein n=1 Tax=Mycena citricolor TaxID=2018698 RepID=A0AAD2HMV1_9AGAR|nr:unnamed protein product [Mycena citricolor]